MKLFLTLVAALALSLGPVGLAPAQAAPSTQPNEIIPGTQEFGSVAKPSVSGSKKVGGLLTAKPKSKPAAGQWTYQWYRNSQPIAGATDRQYRLTGADYRARITVKATAWLDGYRPTESRASSATAKIKRGKLTTTAPRITGPAEIGGQLTADTPGWTDGTVFTYQWYRNNKKIKQATRASYLPGTADKGKRLSVKVTGRQAGYATASRKSAKTAAVRLAAVPEPEQLRVGSFNVTVASLTQRSSNPLARPWEERLPEVVRQIQSEGLHVVGVQEASAGTSATASGRPQFQDLADALGEPWALTNAERYCDTDEAFARCPNGAGQNDRILYRTDRLELLRQGSRKLDGRTSYATGNARFVTWAEFRDLTTGKRFLLFATHLEPLGGDGKAPHATQAAVVLDEIRSQNPEGLPVILVGDLANTKFAKPNTARDAFVKAGFVDSLGNTYRQKTTAGSHAEKVVNGELNSINYFKEKPQRVGGAYKLGSYLDYILVSSPRIRVLEWKTVVGRLDSAGRFADVIPSDHQLVRAVIVLP